MKKIITNNIGVLLVIVLGIVFLCNIPKKIVFIGNKEGNAVSAPIVLSQIIIDNIDEYIDNYESNIMYMANIFQIDYDVLVNKLKEDKSINLFEVNNFDEFLLNYLLNLENTDKDLFDNKITPCEDDKEYILALIKYFCNIYNVDYTIAASIAEIESGYSSPYMLKSNNIFGGMANGKLIRYKNIEYGVLKYIKLLNDGYFSKGLTTVQSIGKVYNPTYNEAGAKIAKPAWVANVTKSMEKYVIHSEVDTATLISLKSVN